MDPQIVAIGGGGFSDGSENLALENFILGLANKLRPRVCFVPTASGDSEQYLLKFYASFAKLPTNATHLPLFLFFLVKILSMWVEEIRETCSSYGMSGDWMSFFARLGKKVRFYVGRFEIASSSQRKTKCKCLRGVAE